MRSHLRSACSECGGSQSEVTRSEIATQALRSNQPVGVIGQCDVSTAKSSR